MVWEVITAIFIGICCTIGVIVTKFLSSRRSVKYDIIENAPFIEVGARKIFTNGYARGRVKSQTPCKNGTTRFEFFPIDYEQGENIPIPPMQVVICKDECIKRYSKGEESPIEIIKLINILPTETSEKLKGTKEGNILEEEGMKSYLKRLNYGLITKSADAINNLIMEEASPYLNRSVLAKLKEENDLMRKIEREKGDEKK